jgi:hypothetical protein
MIVIALIAGAIGYIGGTSAPRTTILTTTVITSGTKSYAIVTFTVIGIQSYYAVVACTTNSNGAATTYTEEFGGPTAATTLIPPNLPSGFIVTVTTTFSEPVTTEYSASQC